MALSPPALVTAPVRPASTFGLFSALTFRTNADRWMAGVAFETASCEPVGGLGAWDCDPDDDDPVIGLPKDFTDAGNGPLGEAMPFSVYGRFACTPTGTGLTGAQDRATAHLLSREEARVEQAFWTGDLGNTPNLIDLQTSDNLTPTPGTGVGLSEGLALLEAHVEGGSVLHMSRYLASLMGSRISASAQRLTTRLGTQVVAGLGYGDQNTPNAGAQWAYVTPGLFGYRGDIFTSSARPGDLLNRATNDLMAVAERSYLIGFDPCRVGAVLIDPTA